jgi:tetratricopeptide (TPR) repeat protein
MSAIELCQKGGIELAARNYYRAVDFCLQAVQQNSAYAPAYVILAKSFYYLGEYEQSLTYLGKAFQYGGRQNEWVTLSGFCFVQTGNFDNALKAFNEVLAKIPGDRDANFGLALLEVRAGKAVNAQAYLAKTLKAAPGDPRALLSMAVLARAEGKTDEASRYVNEALRWLGDEPVLHYLTALEFFEAGNIRDATLFAQKAVASQQDAPLFRLLLAHLYYRQGAYPEAISQIQTALMKAQDDKRLLYLLGISYAGFGKNAEALQTLNYLAGLYPDDEIARLAMENIVMKTMSMEALARSEFADYRFARAKEFTNNFLYGKALQEYRRGLLIYPYANAGRRKYAELIKISGLPATYLEELLFLRDIGKADQTVEDAIEVYNSVLAGSVFRTWKVQPLQLGEAPYSIAVYSTGSGGIPWHPASDTLIAQYLRDTLIFSNQLKPASVVSTVNTFTDAFASARQSGMDFFLLISAYETERDIRISAELRQARTGALIKSIQVTQSGNERIQRACDRILDELANAFQIRGMLINRKGNTGLINLGTKNKVAKGSKFFIIKRGATSIKADGSGLTWPESALIGVFEVTKSDDAVAEGTITFNGPFDSVNVGDTVVLQQKEGSVNVIVPTPAIPYPYVFETLKILY